MNRLAVSALALACAFSLAFVPAQAQTQTQILVNVVGYEKSGAKRAVIQSSGAISATTGEIIDGQGRTVHTVPLSSQATVSGWSGRNFKTADFGEFTQDGKYTLKVGSEQSPEFSIGEKILQRETGASQVSFFKGMRHTGTDDRSVRIHGSSPAKYHNIYGGWWDANGDPGKHLSHLSYANYFNPQQIPLVVWALAHAIELQPTVFGTAAKEEAAWGADYLLRSLAAEGYFYMSVFDNWGGWGMGGGAEQREICEWSTDDGTRSSNYQSAMREGGGMSIAGLARAYKIGISGDSSSAAYLAGAERAYAHLKANPARYQNDGIENIIDDYTGLLAATELYSATNNPGYLEDAQERVSSLLSRQSNEGWFYTVKKNGQNDRPFYHAADEGLPVVALARYVEAANPGSQQAIQNAVSKNFQWYKTITYQNSNPFEYVKMYGTAGSSTDPGSQNIARNGTATASRSEGSFTPGKAIDGNPSNDSRWSSYQNGEENNNQWIAIDLGSVYTVREVVINWEAAYGKSYRIEVSANGNNWTTVATIANNASGGIKTHSFAPTEARHVRMFGVERGLEYGGFSIYEFEVYGEQEQPINPILPARFFMPHKNETGYWWQGENARIASLATSFIMGAALADPSGELWSSTLFGMAHAQLDWILGKNPFAATMMHGFGPSSSYPPYPGNQHTNPNPVRGGICNGITAKDSDENDLEWSNAADGNNWRWIEQWLPHNAWYLAAITALSRRMDNPSWITPIIKSDLAKAPNFKISVINGRSVVAELPFAATYFDIYNMRGQKLFSHVSPAGSRHELIKLPPNIKQGAYLLHAKGANGNAVAGKIHIW